jgi:hypothetical protein
MLPFLVFDLISITVVIAVLFLGLMVAAVNNWELHLIRLVACAVYVCKYYFKNCAINILFLL